MEKGQMEALISSSMISFQREQLGRGAESAKTYIIDDMIVVRLKGTLTPAERQLAQKDEKGKAIIKEMRYQLEEIIRPKLEALIEEITGCMTISFHNDISTKTGERIDVIILERKMMFQ